MIAMIKQCLQWRGVSFFCFMVRRVMQLNMTQVAASLTFTSLLALVPLLTVTLIIVSSTPAFARFSIRFKSAVLGTILPESSAEIGGYLDQFLINVGQLTAVGVVVLCLSALLLMRTIENAFNAIWQVHRPRAFIQQLAVYWTVLTLGPLLLGGVFSIWGIYYDHFGMRSNWPFLARVIEVLSSVAIMTFVFWLLYRIVPNRSVPAVHALIGAFITALIVQGGRHAFGFYVNSLASYQLLYGALASFPVLLMWLYCLWLVILAGAVVTASLSYWKGDAWQRPNDARRDFQNAVEILIALHEAQADGSSVKLSRIFQRLNTGYDQLGLLMDKLSDYDYVQQGKKGWVLKRNAEHIILADVFRLFVFDYAYGLEKPVERALNRALSPVFASLDLSLAAFMSGLTK